MFDVSQPQFWVSLAFVLLVVLSAKKIGKLLAGVLDARGEKIKSELDAAKKIREEAAEVLAMYKQKQAEFAKEAEAILAKAREDAERNTAAAEAELKSVLDARMKQAVEKIAQEEAAAINEVRSHVVSVALQAAGILIAEQMTSVSSDENVKILLSDINRTIH